MSVASGGGVPAAPLSPIRQRLGRRGVPELALAALALVTRLALIWIFLPRPVLTENMSAGFTLAARGYLGDPFSIPTGPTAHVAPLYPALIASMVRLANDQELGFDLARTVVAVAFALFIALLPRVSAMLGLGRGAGLVAAVLLVLPTIPVFAWIEASGQHEAVLTMVALFAMLAVTVNAITTQRVTIGRAAALGLGWGVGMHTSPLLLLALLATLAAATAFAGIPARDMRRFALTLLAALVLTIAPWTIRNYRVIGGPTLIRDNFGLELAVSNADSATPDMRTNMREGASMSRHPYLDTAEARRMRELGERAYYQQRAREATQWISSHPDEFLRLTAQRSVRFFFPRLGMEHHAPFYVFSVLLGAVGLVRLARRNAFVAASLCGAVLAFAIPHSLVQSHQRYSYPVLWIGALLASWVALDAGQRALAGFRGARARRRLADSRS